MIDFILGFLGGCALTAIVFALWVTPKLDEARELIAKLKVDLLYKEKQLGKGT